MQRDDPLLQWAMVPCSLLLLALLILALLRLGKGPEATRPTASAASLSAPVPAAEQTRQFFGWPQRVVWHPMTNSSNPFFSLAIQAPVPATPAPPPPPATRKLDITYRGFIETSAGIRRAVVQVADHQVVGGRGEKIVADFAAVEIELKHLALTNAAGKHVRFDFAKTQAIEVPAQ